MHFSPLRGATVLALLAIVASACATAADTASTTPAASSAAPDAATGDVTTDVIGFIFVGAKDDFGYNQAAYDGSVAVAEAFPDLEVLRAENVPETTEAEVVMQDMIAKGADLIFATSFGHLEFAQNLAVDNPDVVFVHQGGLEGDRQLDNVGTYFGTVYEPVYTAGIAAGAATESGKVGFVYAFPIPQTLANINAFTLGAQSVNPDVETLTISTGNWCDPGLQAQAAQSLIDQGADVLTQHQDCTKTIIEAAEAAGVSSVGYHADASALAPEGWLTGSEWDWDALYLDIVMTVIDGDFAQSPYNGDFRVGLQTGDNPFVQSDFGPSVSSGTVDLIEATRQRFTDGGSPFEGPIFDQAGDEVIPAGSAATYEDAETMDYFVRGVVGSTS